MNRNHLKFKLIFFVFALAISTGQSKYPADTLLSSPKVSFIKKIGILPIAAFQRFSYNADGFNCQYSPSCSNYGSQAIEEYGLLRGSFMASDRIIRCNPSSLENHLKHGGEYNLINKQLIDPFQLPKPAGFTKSPVLAASLSALIPGTGRMYAKHWYDGFMGLSQFLLYAAITNYAYQKDWQALTAISGGITFIIYGGEVYGAYRTAKYYQP
ncbi:MAG: membrane protein insertion efficiency factor YidD [Candidatus Neomarinimicrobiota bacterium]